MQSSTRIELWPGGAPNAAGNEAADKPFMDVYLPQNGNGAAVLVCPGGGYAFLAADHEGEQVARWLNEQGIAAFVLHYRIAPRYGFPAPQQDAQRALRLIRARAEEFGVRSEAIGIWGFSAGGHLAATCATVFDRDEFRVVEYSNDETQGVSSRPNFAVLCYPVVSMREAWMHSGSRDNLIGGNARDELAQLMSPDKQVSAQTPPTFLFHTGEDSGVPVENSLSFYQALRKHNIAAELHVFERGAHGVGLAQDDTSLKLWPSLLANWLQTTIAQSSTR
ncbi:MAG TPA: alpha/beta hydrolase [Abditibacteriaceae bacterium]|nr:alpha/beta hydrolase [Abditibacteriaceae bacterium]